MLIVYFLCVAGSAGSSPLHCCGGGVECAVFQSLFLVFIISMNRS